MKVSSTELSVLEEIDLERELEKKASQTYLGKKIKGRKKEKLLFFLEYIDESL